MTAARALLETGRTTVHALSVDDAPFLLALVNSPGWLRFIGDRGVRDLDAARGLIRDSYLRSYSEHGFGYYLVRATEADAAIGIAGFLKKPFLDHPDFGFALLPEYAGRGLAFESCAAILDFGRRSFDLPVLDAITLPANARSIRLLERLGFVGHGRIRPAADELLLYRLTA